MRVLVIGAGLGGLTLAQALRDSGVEVAVFERDGADSARRQGYRIHINPDGSAALRRALPDRLWRLFTATSGRPGPVSEFYDSRMNVVHRFENPGHSAADLLGHFNVNRLTLREILATGLDDVVRHGRRCTGYRRDGGRVTAHFSDGSRETGDMLVGADGVNSAVRRQLLPHAKIFDSGLRLVYATVPLGADTRRLFPTGMFGGYSAILGPDRTHLGGAAVDPPEPVSRAVSRLVLEARLTSEARLTPASQSDHAARTVPEARPTPASRLTPEDRPTHAARLAPAARLSDFAPYMTSAFGLRTEALPGTDAELFTMDGSALRDLVRARVADWHPMVGRIVDHWNTATVFPLRLTSSVPVGPWPTGNVTVLGDAVHAMSPAGGSGANTAMRDGVELAARLKEAAVGRPLLDAVTEYESAMRDYGFAAVRMSAANGVAMLGQNPLPDPVTT